MNLDALRSWTVEGESGSGKEIFGRRDQAGGNTLGQVRTKSGWRGGDKDGGCVGREGGAGMETAFGGESLRPEEVDLEQMLE